MKDATKLIHLGRPKPDIEGTVNHPVYRASTILSPDIKSYMSRFEGDRRYTGITYGAVGTQNAKALGEAVAAFEGAYGCVVTGSGLSAVTMAISAFVSAGDHVLMTDSVYGPARKFCNEVLARYGVETTFYDPSIGGEISALIRDNTALVYTEAPGSLTFEMQDIPAIANAAKARGVTVAMDNTWATPLYFKPLEHGVDVSIQAGTKYFAGHSDVIIGMISCASEEHHRRVLEQRISFGDVAGPDDCFMALRGLRSLTARLPRQSETALHVAEWLVEQPSVVRVLYPALPDDPGHALWKRDFNGASSLFGLVLDTQDLDAIARFTDGLELFQIGSSWGGYESLVALNQGPLLARDVKPWTESQYLLRLHIGLEDADDLVGDLDAALGRMFD